MRSLLGEGGKTDTDLPAIRLAVLLARAHRGQIQQLGAQLDARRIIAIVETKAADRRERHLLGAHQIEGPHLVGLAPDGAGDLVDEPLDHKTCPRTADAAIGAERRFVRRDRVVP